MEMPNSNDPLVSIVIPTKNGMPYIVECIESLVDSSYQNLEILISDDQSTDGTLEYLMSLSDPRIRVLTSDREMTMSENWNRVKSLATGKYVKLLCSDDTVLKDGITNQITVLEGDTQIILVSSKRQIIDKFSKVRIQKTIRGVGGKLESRTAIRKSFLAGTNIFGEPSSVMFRNTESFALLNWSSDWNYLLDFEYYCRFLLEKERSVVSFLNSVDATFRVHSSSLSAKISKTHFEEFLSLAKTYQPLFKFSKLEINVMKFNCYIISKIRIALFWYFK